jgi:hypothetical protein
MTIGPYNATGSSRKNHDDARMGVPGAKEILAQRIIHLPLFNKEVSRKYPPYHLHAPRADAASMQCSPTSGKAKNWTHHRPGTNYGRFADQGLI